MYHQPLNSQWIEEKRKEILSSPIDPLQVSAALLTDKNLKRKLYKCTLEGIKFVTLDAIPTVEDMHRNKGLVNLPNMEKISIWRGDITTLEVDGIVNCANEGLLGGVGSDEAIHQAAGPLLQRECANLPICSVGDTKITKGYLLPATYVLHTVGPYLDENNRPQPILLLSCYKTIFELVEQYGLRSIALGSISTGFYGFPKDQAAQIAVEFVMEWLKSKRKERSHTERIIFTCFTKEDERIYTKAIFKYLENSGFLSQT